MLQLLNKVTVDKRIKPLPYSRRKKPQLEIGGSYFVSFAKNCAYPCTLTSFDENSVTIAIPAKSKSKKAIAGMKGTVVESHILDIDCIGTTPEEAILNQGNYGLATR